MTQRKKLWIGSLVVLAVVVLAGYIDWPKAPTLPFWPFNRSYDVRLGLDLQGGSSLTYEADVANIPPSEQSDALDGVRDVVERRVNAFGVSEPLVQTNRVGDAWRVIVELAGVFDVDQAIQLIGETPLLDFKTLKPPPEKTAEEIAQINAANEAAKKQAEEILARATAPDADFPALANEFSEDPGNTVSESEKNGGDLDWQPQGTFVPEFDDVVFSKLQPGEVYPQVVETTFGYHIIKLEETRTGQDADGADIPEARARHILFSKQSSDAADQLYAYNPDNYESTGLTGKQLQQSSVAFDPQTGAPQVTLQFNDEGAKLFAEVTKNNIGKVVSIFLDNAPISQPVVQTEITSGQAVISGNFTLDEARTLARRLNAGALPVPIHLVNQQNVGPTLGQVSVERSLLAGLIGIVVVSLFMIVYYRLPGLMAVLALAVYTMIVLAIFKLWPVTLTLAGVAGFILSIGMAVDANILIFERMREELRAGKNLHEAIDEGFRRAWLSIRDSNVSSLITTFILAWLGTSIIKGFAITLGIGIVVSMFSAITVSRVLLRLVIRERLRHHPLLVGIRV